MTEYLHALTIRFRCDSCGTGLAERTFPTRDFERTRCEQVEQAIWERSLNLCKVSLANGTELVVCERCHDMLRVVAVPTLVPQEVP